MCVCGGVFWKPGVESGQGTITAKQHKNKLRERCVTKSKTSLLEEFVKKKTGNKHHSTAS